LSSSKPNDGAVPQAVLIPDTVTVCITSCARLDLLAKTLSSFRQFNSGGKYILSEDSTDAAVIAEVKARYPGFLVLSGQERLGIMRSIDRLYGAVTTPYIFHLEDDWQFDGAVNWPAAIALLEARDDVANVCVRDINEIREKYRERSDTGDVVGASYRIMRRDSHPEFFGWSPNPGLIKLSLYKQYAPFSQVNPDQMSGIIKRDGRSMAYLLPGVARHIGQDRNVIDPTVPARPKSRVQKLLRSMKKQLYYAGWRKSPY
jgi:hypothetical protein